MRICFLVSNDMTHDPRVSRHAETLGKLGHEVIVTCPKSDSTDCAERKEYYAIRRFQPGFTKHHLRTHARKENRDPLASSRGRRKTSFVRRLIEFGGRIFFAVLIRPLWLTLSLWRSGREFSAHVYVANDLDTLLAGALCAIGPRKLVYDAHELWPDQISRSRFMLESNPFSFPPVNRWLRILEGVLIRRANVVITVNEYIAAVLAQRYSIGDPYVILNVPPASSIALKETSRIQRLPGKTVLYQGAYMQDRGLENLVRASEFLEEDVTLLLRGYGPIEPCLRKIAERFRNCHLQPPVPMESLVIAASTADVGVVSYVATNLNNYFSSPNKLFEYIQAGLPVVGSNLPFLRKIILGHEIGYVFDPNDPREIARAINMATRDATLHKLRENVMRIQTRYSWEEEHTKLTEIFGRLASST
jgi:glycogen(starch) synthase